MRKSKRALASLGVILGASLAISGCAAGGGGEGAVTGDTIKIGVILPLTGSLAPDANEMLNGYKVAQAMINENGGVNGKQIEYVVSDAPTPEDAVAVAGRLSTNPDIALIMGSYSSGIAISASAVAERNKKVYWETGSLAPETTARGLEYIFRTNGNTGMPAFKSTTVDFFEQLAAPAMGKSMKDIRIGLAYENGEFGTSSANALEEIAKSHGWNVVTKQAYSATASDLSSVIENMKVSKAEVLYMISYVNDAALLIDQADELGFNPKLVFGVGASFSSPDLVKALGSRVDGLTTSSNVPLHINDDILNGDMSPTYSEFIKEYEEMNGTEPRVMATLGYQGAMVLFQNVLPHADVSDAQSIMAAAKNVDIPQGGTVGYNGVKFDETGQNVLGGFYNMQYQDGELVPVYPTAAATAEIRIKK